MYTHNDLIFDCKRVESLREVEGVGLYLQVVMMSGKMHLLSFESTVDLCSAISRILTIRKDTI